jgi:hypothetical protein
MLSVSKLRVGKPSNNRVGCKLYFVLEKVLHANREWSKLPDHAKLACRLIMPKNSNSLGEASDLARGELAGDATLMRIF